MHPRLVRVTSSNITNTGLNSRRGHAVRLVDYA